MTKIWYELWGNGPGGYGLLAKVRLPGLAELIKLLLKPYYTDMEIR